MLEQVKHSIGMVFLSWGKALTSNRVSQNAPAVPTTVLYDVASRIELEETLGYERFVLRECCNIMASDFGASSPIKIAIDDSGHCGISASAADHFGDNGAALLRKLSPLVFTASYKLIDMVIEWVIRQNGLPCPFQFAQKIALIHPTSGLQYPDFLGADVRLRDVLTALYENQSPYRNAIIHGCWGRVVDGSLEFDFVRSGRRYRQTMSFGVVLALADSLELMSAMLVGQVADDHKLNTLRWLFDQLAPLHGRPSFGIGRPAFLYVVRMTKLPTTGPVTIDLDEIRAVADRQAAGPVSWDLTVQAETNGSPVVWQIPSSAIPSSSMLVLDDRWEQYLVP